MITEIAFTGTPFTLGLGCYGDVWKPSAQGGNQVMIHKRKAN